MKPIAASLALACTMATAHADVVFQLSNTYTGMAPAGSGPWATATFTQTGTDMVRLLLQSSLSGVEFLSNAFFNVDPSQSFTAAYNSTLSSGTFAAPVIDIGQNQFIAGGGGRYDARLGFASGPPGDRFDGGDLAVFDLSGIGLTEGDFNFLSTGGGGGQNFPFAAHIQGIGPNGSGSGWITVPPTIIPLPPAAFAGAGCLVLVAGCQWVNRKRASKR